MAKSGSTRTPYSLRLASQHPTLQASQATVILSNLTHRTWINIWRARYFAREAFFLRRILGSVMVAQSRRSASQLSTIQPVFIGGNNIGVSRHRRP